MAHVSQMAKSIDSQVAFGVQILWAARQDK